MTADANPLWTGSGAQGWIAAQDVLDRTFRPFERLLADAAEAAAPRRVLDVGCGTGATTVAIARRLGPGAACMGVDVSESMIDAARARARREGVAADFVLADAQTHAFEAASVDLIVSRFGVMFFEDPIVAFANLRRAGAEAGRLHGIVWRSIEENHFLTAAERAAEPLLPGVSSRPPDEPGPFFFADPARGVSVLTKAGWQDAALTPVDVPCAFPAADLDLFMNGPGPVPRALKTVDDATRRKVIDVVRPAYDRYREDGEIRFTARCWVMQARAGRAATPRR